MILIAKQTPSLAASTISVVSGRIDHLVWSLPESNEVSVLAQDKGKPPEAELNGIFESNEYSLRFNSKTIVPKTNKRTPFSIRVPLRGETTTFELIAVAPNRPPQKATFSIIRKNSEKSGQSVSLGISLGTIQIFQTGHSDFSEKMVTLKAGDQLSFSPSWALLLNGEFTAVPFSSNLSGVNARFLNLDLLLDYKLPLSKIPWSLLLSGGLRYTTMLVTQSTFGYQNEVGPQVSLLLKIPFRNETGVKAYLKYAMFTTATKALNNENRELSVGAAGFWKLKNQHSMSLSLDYSIINLVFNQLSSTFRANSLSSGLEYEL